MNYYIIMFLIALIFAILFWVWVVRLIIAKISKTQFGKKNIFRLLLFGLFGWIFFFIGVSIFIFQWTHGGYEKAVQKSANVAAVTFENAKKGWKSGLLKKLDSLTFEIDSVREISDEMKLTNSDSNFNTYEATLIVNNTNSDKNITYKELRDANVVYAQDENGIYIPSFIVNHSTFDEIPWLFRFFLPKYRREAENQFLPIGRSYLNVRIDVALGHMPKSIGIGDHLIDISSDKILSINNE